MVDSCVAMDKRNALVVDDSPEHRRLIKIMLGLRGFAIEEATNGADALKLIENAGRHYDVVFSDVSMPNMNGFELLKRVKRQARFKDLPVIMLTSEHRQEDLAMGQRLGCTYYMLKPFGVDELHKALNAAHLG